MKLALPYSLEIDDSDIRTSVSILCDLGGVPERIGGLAFGLDHMGIEYPALVASSIAVDRRYDRLRASAGDLTIGLALGRHLITVSERDNG
ncbi:hypothetical protein H0V99_04025 [Candidatus Saccharibacteria bacterium]|nr:hypothetical protein [Candidatus Saccharibacteria bacterium]